MTAKRSKAVSKRKKTVPQVAKPATPIDLALLTKDTPKGLEKAIKGVLPGVRHRVCACVAEFLHLTASGETCLDALEAAGLTWGQLQSVKGASPAVMALYEQARDLMRLQQISQRERALLKRGVDGWEEPVWHKGDMVGTIRRFSDKCLELGLKANQPKKYRDKTDNKVNVGVSISFISNGVGSAQPATVDVEAQDVVVEGDISDEPNAS